MSNSLTDSGFELIRFQGSRTSKIVSRESDKREFKESFNWNSIEKYAKSLVAFANKNGGYLIFGVSNSPRLLVGLKNSSFESLDEKRIVEFLNGYFSPEIFFEKFIRKTHGSTVGVLKVHKSEDSPIVCIKNGAEIKEADIYYRYNATSQRIKYPELRKVLEQIRDREKDSWMRYLSKMSHLGIENTAILDLNKGQISGARQDLLIDEKLLPKLKFIKKGSFTKNGHPTLKLIGNVKPVSLIDKKLKTSIRVTNDPNAPEIRIGEEDIRKLFPLDYTTLTEKLKKRYINFSANSKYHEIRKRTKGDKKIVLVRHLDPDNPKSAKKDFYSPNIIKVFDKYYEKKSKK